MQNTVVADRKFFWQLFKSTFIISAFTIGGGFVIIPLLKAKFVDEFHWLEDKDALNMVAIAQSAPGVVAVNAAISIGYRLAGIRGTMVAILATVLPPLIIIGTFIANYCFNINLMTAVIADAIIGLVLLRDEKYC